MEENNKGFIFISNDKEADTTIKVNYKSFVFFDVYGLENDKIYKIVDDLVYQFDLRAGKEHFFEEESFVVLIEGGKEIIQQEFEGRMLKLYREPSSSRAYPMRVEEKAAYYKQMFKDTEIL